MNYSLKNELVSFTIDEQARVTELKNLKTGHDYAGGQGLWRIIYSKGQVLQEDVHSDNCSPDIEILSKDELRIVYSRGMIGSTGKEEFFLSIEVKLNADEINFSAELINNSKQNCTIREFDFPIVRNISIANGQCFFCGTLKIDDIPGAIEQNSSGYMADDKKGINLYFTEEGRGYDGFAMLANDRDGLYFGDHDETFEVSTHLLKKRKDEIDVGIHKSPYLTPGKSRIYRGYVISPYVGDWHIGAKKFRKWADTWFDHMPAPHSITSGFNGWYRIIMRHQYGKILFPHDELPRILKSMKETGIDSLLLFGWWSEGMDAGYPNYNFDESQGGKAALKEHIRKFRADGGKILLYFNGRLIDTATDFYKETGKGISVIGCDGQPLIERYAFEGEGIDLRSRFGNKSFSLACPHSIKWMDILKRHIDTAIELDVDGVFFDQLGMAENPCFGENHGHSVPSLDHRALRMTQLKEIRDYIKQRRPKMSFGFECLQNTSCGFADYIHSFPGWNAATNDWLGNREKPKLARFIELFRYTFPEVRLSDREIRDDTDIERRVNLALLRGLVSDVEVHRARALIDETPQYKAYLTKANKLRDKFRRLILNGRFQDTDGAFCNNEELSWSVFTAGNELAIIATQSHLEQVSATFQVLGYSFKDSGSLGQGFVSTENGETHVVLGRHALVVMVYREN